jgi:hypothetical protein
MVTELSCNICKKNFCGRKGTMYCSNDCKNTAKRKRRNDKREGERRKEANKKYYLKTKHVLTKKYKKEQEEKEKRKKEYGTKWNTLNKVKNAEYRRKTREKNRLWFDEYKKTLKCEICGYNRCVGALDFHHKDPEGKDFHIAKAVGLRYSKERILKEIKKCTVLCAICHRELHYEEEQEKVKRQREEYLKIINSPKIIYYNIVEKELGKEWVKRLQDKAKYNLSRFGGNQFIRIDGGMSEKIDIKKVLSKKIGIGEKSICRILQVYKRGTEEQKERARTGESSITKIYKELKPIRYSKNIK